MKANDILARRILSDFIQRHEDLVPENPHDDSGIFNKFFQLAFFFFRDVAGIGVIPVFDDTASRLGCLPGELIFQIADSGRTSEGSELYSKEKINATFINAEILTGK